MSEVKVLVTPLHYEKYCRVEGFVDYRSSGINDRVISLHVGEVITVDMSIALPTNFNEAKLVSACFAETLTFAEQLATGAKE